MVSSEKFSLLEVFDVPEFELAAFVAVILADVLVAAAATELVSSSQ
jgi:hypothetical protein